MNYAARNWAVNSQLVREQSHLFPSIQVFQTSLCLVFFLVRILPLLTPMVVEKSLSGTQFKYVAKAVKGMMEVRTPPSLICIFEKN